MEFSAEKITGGLLLKPDALSGIYSQAHTQRISDCFYALAISVRGEKNSSKNFYVDSSFQAAVSAWRQISERAQTEKTFSQPILNSDKCAEYFFGFASIYRNKSQNLSLKKVAKQILEGFGFTIVTEIELQYSTKEILKIYGKAIQENNDLQKPLIEYLSGKMGYLLVVSNEQNYSALEWTKTYLRYFFRYKTGERHCLQNLAHASPVEEINSFFNFC